MPVQLEDIFASWKPRRVVAAAGKFLPVDLSADAISASGLSPSECLANITRDRTVIPYGGYAEKRSLYDGFTRFDNRQWHIGVDIWAAEGTAVWAACDGKVHSFAYNAGEGNYGPTIILEHQAGSHIFYTLYGHLDVASIEELEMDDHFAAGETIGHIGSRAVNGGYLPHLHFQVIHNLGPHCGDYPGVCSQAELPHYLKNCPDPNLLLKLT